MGRGGIAQPKPEPIKRTKARKQREDRKLLKQFQDDVWGREGIGDAIFGWGRCQGCQVVVSRDGLLEGPTGEVHHRIGRRAKATRYDSDNGVLLCNYLLNDCHGKVTRHEMECP